MLWIANDSLLPKRVLLYSILKTTFVVALNTGFSGSPKRESKNQDKKSFRGPELTISFLRLLIFMMRCGAL